MRPPAVADLLENEVNNNRSASSARRAWKVAVAPQVALAVACGAIATPFVAGAAETPFPTKSIRWIVPFPPAGITDIVARLTGPKMTETWGQPVIIDNRSGAGGAIGTEIAARATPDGYTLLGTPLNFVLYPTLYRNISFKVPEGFAPITLVAAIPSILMVHPSVQANSVKELIALAKAKPGGLSYGSGGGVGSGSHVAAELFKRMAGVDIVHVPYKGGAPVAVAIASGEVQVLFGTAASIIQTVRSGKVRPIAVSTAKRFYLMPELPTIAEAGVPGFESEEMQGVVAPAGTPRDVIRKLHAEMVRALKSPDVSSRLRDIGANPIGSTPEEFKAYLDREVKRWADLFRGSGIVVEF